MVKPHEISLTTLGVLTDTLGHAEEEMVAALIVRWHQLQGLEDWQPVSRNDIGNLIVSKDEVVAGWARNPFWRPRPYEFCEKGFVTAWHDGPDAKGTLTEKFFAALDVRAAKDVEREQCVLLAPDVVRARLAARAAAAPLEPA